MEVRRRSDLDDGRGGDGVVIAFISVAPGQEQGQHTVGGGEISRRSEPQAYDAIGAAVSVLFLTVGRDRCAPAARGAYAFRALLAPGIVLLWPLAVITSTRVLDRLTQTLAPSGKVTP